MQANKPCFCGAKKAYQKCCGRFIDEKIQPTTAEELMRSRYSAFTQNNIAYIEKTMTGPAAVEFEFQSALSTAKQTKWLGLKVLKTFLDPNDSQTAFVEFIASFREKGGPNPIQYLHETSEFRLIDQCWYYYDGQLMVHEHGHGCGC